MGMPLMDSSKNIEISTTASPSPPTYHHVVVQQSVTMLAYMDRSSRNETDLTGITEPRILLGFTLHDLPILIGAAAGAVGLTVIILVAVIVWHCCRGSQNREKAYSVETIERGDGKRLQPTVVHSSPPPPAQVANSDGFLQNDMIVFVGGKPTQLYETQLIESNKNGIRRSQSLSLKEQGKTVVGVNSNNKSRPSSQPLVLEKQSNISGQSNGNGDVFGLPCVPESDRNRNIPQISQCASYSALDEPSNIKYMLMVDDNGINAKTHSLPNWVRNRPLSTEDDLNELYAKVNFSKKRKNRMGNDSAAAIAMNKNCSAFLASPQFSNKDTDSLVENEAVVVYDERTSL